MANLFTSFSARSKARPRWTVIGLAVYVLGLVAALLGWNWRTAPPVDALAGVGFAQHPNVLVPPDIPFTDEQGEAIHFGDYTGRGPIILVPGYDRKSVV